MKSYFTQACDLLHRALLVALVLMLAACATRPDASVLKAVSVTDPAAKQVTVYVATTRAKAKNGEPGFTAERSPTLTYARYVISIPPVHKVSTIEWPQPKSKPDPSKHFVTVSSKELTEADFLKAVAAEPKLNPDMSEHFPMVFVHGFNYNFQESLYQMAQMATDSDNIMVPVLFAWPSDASITGYVADRDSVMFSRDALTHVLSGLTALPGSKQIVVTAHSMGAFLTAEVLRQMRLTGKNDVIGKLRVALASPDIDLDVFESEIGVIGPMNPPLTVMVAGDDRALGISSKITGDRLRLGNIDLHSPEIKQLAARANLQIIDFSELDSADSFKHNRFFGLPAMFKKLEAQGAARNKNPFGLQGLFSIKLKTAEVEQL